MHDYKCNKKYFGFKTSEEYVEHCKWRESIASTESAKRYWRELAERGSWLY